MNTIPVKVCGDIWVNPDEVRCALDEIHPDQYLTLDFLAEGPSVTLLGILEWCQHRSSYNTFVNLPNRAETLPFINKYQGHSHFFNFARNYWVDVKPVNHNACVLGYFMGRRTWARAKILWDLWRQFQDITKFSVMFTPALPPWIEPSSGINFELNYQWFSSSELDQFVSWFNRHPIVSIDGHYVRDQYTENPTTNQDILNYYDQFHVELVAETYTLGNTFFPTEKTIRPIMAAKPMLVYGPRNFLQRLKEMGFKTYQTCWDESYDQLEGLDRWQAIKQIIPTIQVTGRALDIAQYNREHLCRVMIPC